MNLTIIGNNEYQNFLKSNEYKFQQTSAMGKLRQKSGWKIHQLGLYDQNDLRAVALIAQYNGRLGYNYFDCQAGPVLDYTNFNLVTTFFEQLYLFLKEKKASYFAFNPYIIRAKYSFSGEKNTAVEEQLSNFEQEFIKLFKNLGYKHQSLQFDVNGQWNMRWFFQKKLNGLKSEELIKSFNSQGKRSSKKAQANRIITREASDDELDVVKELLDSSAHKQNFEIRPLGYYQNLKKEFQDNVIYMLAEINIEEYLAQLKKTIGKNKIQIEKFQAKDKVAQAEDLLRNQRSLKKSLTKYEEILKTNGEKMLPLSSGVFIKTEYELIYLFGGNDEQYQELCSSYSIQTTMMNQAISENIPIYNFYGISPLGTKGDGVLKFKQGFDGEIIELIGTFELSLDKSKVRLHKFFNKLKKLKS